MSFARAAMRGTCGQYGYFRDHCKRPELTVRRAFNTRGRHGEREKGKFERLGRRRGEREIYRTGFPYFLYSVKEEELRQSNMKKESNSKTSIQYDEPNIPNFMKSCSKHQQPIEEQPSNLHKQLEVGSLGQLGGRNRQIYINQLGRLKVLGLG